jgi:hypothetical protein
MRLEVVAPLERVKPGPVVARKGRVDMLGE